ncbi:MAG: chemotaxis protein CheA [Spirochaetaceae bacterium]|nr:chemotaxis protein CheA [Spirochaetaceae bacterium]
MSDYLDPANEELLKDYFMEAQAQIEILERNILVLEDDPKNREAIDEIFRAAHTLKGNSGAVEMFEIAEFTHQMEDLLDEIRGGKVSVNGEIIDTMLEAIDIVKEMIESRMAGEIYSADYKKVKDRLKSFMAGQSGAGQSAQAGAGKGGLLKKGEAIIKQASEAAAVVSENKKLSKNEIIELYSSVEKGERLYNVEVAFNKDNPMNSIGGVQVFAKLKEISSVLMTKPDFDMLYEDNYYPIVDYFVATTISQDELPNMVKLADVTDNIIVTEIKSPEGSDMPVEKQVSEKPAAVVAEAPGNAMDDEKVADDKVDLSEEQDDDKDDKLRQQKTKKAVTSESTILKVDSKRIDNLLNLVSETVINKATFNQISTQFLGVLNDMHSKYIKINDVVSSIYDSMESFKEDGNEKNVKKDLYVEYEKIKTDTYNIEASLKNTITKLVNAAQNFGRIANELHEGVLQIRMVPIAQIFSRFPRLVRDVSKKLNKKIQLVIEGEETELDKSVIEQLLDPLIHLVRNSMDHGVETPEIRKQSNKKEEGTIILRARNEGNMIHIEIVDDGKGIDVDIVREKAISRGIIHPGKNLTDVEAYNLIFEPGFSTAKEITDISGRGVGLDVVRKSIDKLNGSVNVWSKKGVGTTTSIRLPLTLAIIQGFLVRIGKEIYAIPITSVIESQRILSSEIKFLDNYEVFDLREDVVSLMRLNRLFGIPTDEDKTTNYVVVVGNADKKIGLMVDQLIGEEDVVIKPLKDKYTGVQGIAGATILGDGQVSLILDINQIMELCLKKEHSAKKSKISNY